MAVGKEALANLIEVTSESGVEPPDVPALLRPGLRVLGEWQWGTHDFDPMAHHFDDTYVNWLLTEWDRRPLYLFSNSGYGVNSYSLNVTVSIGSLAIYATSSFGGAYAEPRLDAARANLLFRRVDALLHGIRIAEPLRWLVVSGALRAGRLLVDLDEFGRHGYPGGFAGFSPHFDPSASLPWQRRDDEELFAEGRGLLNLRAGVLEQTGSAHGMATGAPLIDIWLLRHLQGELPADHVFGTAEVAGERWAFFADGDEHVLAVVEGDFLGEVERYESFAALLRGVGGRLDERWDSIPVDDRDKPRPIVLLREETGVRVLHRTPEGVQGVEELTDEPGALLIDDRVWGSFAEALNWEADEGEVRV